ncbi:MAG: hypothetical protein GC134_02980 [Proteobacteria bacterium]|nr:hypothetical protein [Pseudomonadota bacterium]
MNRYMRVIIDQDALETLLNSDIEPYKVTIIDVKQLTNSQDSHLADKEKVAYSFQSQEDGLLFRHKNGLYEASAHATETSKIKVLQAFCAIADHMDMTYTSTGLEPR